MTELMCRACRGRSGWLVLDLGAQPACDYFPAAGDPGPDPTYPLQMWLCASCGLAQLAVDPTVPDEPKAIEPAALVAQAADAVARVATAGWLTPGARATEYGSPHGGSWLQLLQERGLSPARADEPADVVLDCFGMMHDADQAAALTARADRVAPGGVLLLQYHSLATIVGRAQWTSLRHGHFAYYSTTALTRMLATVGFVARSAWRFELYGGTVLLAATRAADAAGRAGPVEPDASVVELLEAERRAGVTSPDGLAGLERNALAQADALHGWLAECRASGRSVLGYGAASRAVSLLCRAGIDRGLLAGIADASPAKQGGRMPGTDIPVIHPDELVASAPDEVLLLLPDLLAEVRSGLPGVEAAGGRWVDVEQLLSDRVDASDRSVGKGGTDSEDRAS